MSSLGESKLHNQRPIQYKFSPGREDTADPRVVGRDSNVNLINTDDSKKEPAKTSDTMFRAIDADSGKEVFVHVASVMPEPSAWLKRWFWNLKFPMRQKFPMIMPIITSFLVAACVDQFGGDRVSHWVSLGIRIFAYTITLFEYALFSYWIFNPTVRTVQKVRQIRTVYLIELLGAMVITYAGLYASVEFLVPGSISFLDADNGFTIYFQAMYFSTILISSVGFGRMSPVTWQAQFLVWTQSAMLFFTAYALIAVAMPETKSPDIIRFDKRDLPTKEEDLEKEHDFLSTFTDPFADDDETTPLKRKGKSAESKKMEQVDQSLRRIAMTIVTGPGFPHNDNTT